MEIPVATLDKLDYRDPTQISTVVIHHTVLDPTLDITDVAAFEMNHFGFYTIGYNAYVKKIQGRESSLTKEAIATRWVVQQGRPVDKLPAAQYGLNAQGYAIAVGGNYEPGATSFLTPIEDLMIDAVVGQIHALKEHYPWVKHLIGHKDVADIMKEFGDNPEDYSTLCPGKNLYNHLDILRQKTGLLPYEPGLGNANEIYGFSSLKRRR